MHQNRQASENKRAVAQKERLRKIVLLCFAEIPQSLESKQTSTHLVKCLALYRHINRRSVRGTCQKRLPGHRCKNTKAYRVCELANKPSV